MTRPVGSNPAAPEQPAPLANDGVKAPRFAYIRHNMDWTERVLQQEAESTLSKVVKVISVVLLALVEALKNIGIFIGNAGIFVANQLHSLVYKNVEVISPTPQRPTPPSGDAETGTTVEMTTTPDGTQEEPHAGPAAESGDRPPALSVEEDHLDAPIPSPAHSEEAEPLSPVRQPSPVHQERPPSPKTDLRDQSVVIEDVATEALGSGASSPVARAPSPRVSEEPPKAPAQSIEELQAKFEEAATHLSATFRPGEAFDPEALKTGLQAASEAFASIGQTDPELQEMGTGMSTLINHLMQGIPAAAEQPQPSAEAETEVPVAPEVNTEESDAAMKELHTAVGELTSTLAGTALDAISETEEMMVQEALEEQFASVQSAPAPTTVAVEEPAKAEDVEVQQPASEEPFNLADLLPVGLVSSPVSSPKAASRPASPVHVAPAEPETVVLTSPKAASRPASPVHAAPAEPETVVLTSPKAASRPASPVHAAPVEVVSTSPKAASTPGSPVHAAPVEVVATSPKAASEKSSPRSLVIDTAPAQAVAEAVKSASPKSEASQASPKRVGFSWSQPSSPVHTDSPRFASRPGSPSGKVDPSMLVLPPMADIRVAPPIRDLILELEQPLQIGAEDVIGGDDELHSGHGSEVDADELRAGDLSESVSEIDPDEEIGKSEVASQVDPDELLGEPDSPAANDE